MVLHSAKFSHALRLGVLELVLLLLGMIFVRRELWELHASTLTIEHWQEGLLLPLSVIDGAITGAYGSRRRNVSHIPAYERMLKWATPLFFLLYVSCSALCERVNFGVFTMAPELWRTLGLALVITGLGLRIWAANSSPSALTPEPADQGIATESAIVVGPETLQTGDIVQTALIQQFPSGPHKLLRYPDSAARLLSLVGLALVFNSWLALLILPGLLVLMKWHISDQEAFRISQLGEPYLHYRKQTWNLIPFIY